MVVYALIPIFPPSHRQVKICTSPIYWGLYLVATWLTYLQGSHCGHALVQSPDGMCPWLMLQHTTHAPLHGGTGKYMYVVCTQKRLITHQGNAVVNHHVIALFPDCVPSTGILRYRLQGVTYIYRREHSDVSVSLLKQHSIYSKYTFSCSYLRISLELCRFQPRYQVAKASSTLKPQWMGLTLPLWWGSTLPLQHWPCQPKISRYVL